MSEPTLQTVTIQQSLFGYDDGHRLLATSEKIPDSISSALLPYTDLASGVYPSRQGYWTGLPVASERVYALMRTWPAPEMPRPGCVWTHVLWIRFPDFARFADMSSLWALSRRPEAGSAFEDYERSLVFLPHPDVEIRRPNTDTYIKVLRTLYNRENAYLEVEPGEPFEASIFDVWSQQWPRVRRSFSFQTAVFSESALRNTRMDMRVTSLRRSDQREPPVSPWEEAALEDLVDPGASGFRRFMWRYGSDMRRGLDRFCFLAQLYVDTQTQKYPFGRTISQVLAAVPQPEDARLLKSDLLSIGPNAYSFFEKADPFEVLNFYLDFAERGDAPPPSDEVSLGVNALWNSRPYELLQLGERAVERNSTLAQSIISDIASVAASSSTFIEDGAEFPRLRRAIVSKNPELLDSPSLVSISAPDRTELLALVPEDEALATRLVDRLFVCDEPGVAELMMSRFPRVVASKVLVQLSRRVRRQEFSLPMSWLVAIRRTDGVKLARFALSASRTTEALAATAIALDYNIRDGVEAGIARWAVALRRAKDNVSGAERVKIAGYLLTLALTSPAKVAELLFEFSFEIVHRELQYSRLPYDTFDRLSPLFYDVPIYHHWDSCLRLRLAVVMAYVDQGLSLDSFRRLTVDRGLMGRLEYLASETKQGRRYLKSAKY